MKRKMNYICVLGLIVSLLSIPLYVFCLGQMLSLILCTIGYLDAKKWNNKGSGLAILGMLVSVVLLVAAPITIFYIIKIVSGNMPYIDPENANLLMKIALRLVYRFLV